MALRRIRDVAVRSNKRYYLALRQSQLNDIAKCSGELFGCRFGRDVRSVIEFEQETAPYAIATSERIINLEDPQGITRRQTIAWNP